MEIDRETADALEIIGQGLSGTVYRCGDDKVLKLYRGDWTEEMVRSAYRTAQSVRAGGVLTAEPFDMVSCGGRYGIISQRLTGVPLVRFIKDDTLRRYGAAERMGAILRQVHSLEKDTSVFPGVGEMFGGILGTVSGYFTDAQICRFIDFAEGMPGPACVLHGDFHENNIMVCGGEYYLIDLDSMCIGSPFFDLMQSYCTYRTPLPEEYIRYMKLTDDILDEFLLRFLGSYFGTDDRERLEMYDGVFTRASGFMRFFAPLYMRKDSEADLRDYVRERIDGVLALTESLGEEFDRISL